MNGLSAVAIAAILGAFIGTAWRRIPLSLTLSFAVLVVFALEYASFVLPALQPPIVVDLAWIPHPMPGSASAPWSFFTTIFVHASLLHLMFNLLGFLLITPVLEDRIGSFRWGLVFLLGAAVGQGVFWLANPSVGVALVGSSGGLLAVLGAFGRLYPRERITLFLPLLFLPTVPVIWVVLGYLLFSFVMTTTDPLGVAHEAHLGGLAFGFAVAPLIMRIPSRKGRSSVASLSIPTLEPLATTRELRAMLDEIRAADIAEVQIAWLEKFAAKARCPRCAGALRHRRGVMVSKCGWRSDRSEKPLVP